MNFFLRDQQRPAVIRHGNLLKKAYKLPAGKCKLSHLSLGSEFLIWLAVKIKTNFWRFLSYFPCYELSLPSVEYLNVGDPMQTISEDWEPEIDSPKCS